MSKSNYDVRQLISAAFSTYSSNGEFEVKCGNTTKTYKNVNIEKAAKVVSLFERLKRNPEIWDIVFTDKTDEGVCEALALYADELLTGKDSTITCNLSGCHEIHVSDNLTIYSTDNVFRTVCSLLVEDEHSAKKCAYYEGWTALIMDELKQPKAV